MPPILLCWPTTWEADVGGMAVEVEPSHHYPVTFCCCVTDGSRGAVWQNTMWHGSVQEATTESLHVEKCHPLTFTDVYRRYTETKQWMWAQWDGGAVSGIAVISSGADFYEGSMQALVHRCSESKANGGDCWKIVFCSWEFALLNSDTVLFVSVVVSMEISRSHYYQSDLCIFCFCC